MRQRFQRLVRRHSRLIPVAAKLATDNIVRIQRRNCFQNLCLLVANRFAVRPHGRLHGEVAQDLEQMVLDHVADRAGLIVESAAALDAEVLSHRDLDALDVVPVPERLHEGVGETEDEHVVYRPLSEVVVDAEN